MHSFEYYYQRLLALYREFYTEDNRCPCYCNCKPKDQDCKFFSDKVKLGKNYGADPTIPKILFVGIEGLHKDNLGLVSDIEPPYDGAYNPHFKGVRYVTAYLHQRLNNSDVPKNSLKSNLKGLSDTIQLIALTNFYKCAFGKGAIGLEHTDSMNANCPHILLREIEVLEPDVIVIQATRRPSIFFKQLEAYFGKADLITGDEKTGLYRCAASSKSPILILYTYHGSSDPTPNSRSWSNDRYCRYINSTLNPVLDATVEEIKKLNPEYSK